VALFEEAVAARAAWKDFPGFKASFSARVDGRAFSGTVHLDARGGVTLETEEEAASPWVQEQLESIVLHRNARTGGAPAEARKPVLRFADEETGHPFGRLLVFEGGRFASSYRVKDRQLLVVNRHLGDQYMTITVLDNERNLE